VTTQEAKQILIAHRPWSEAGDDPEVQEALALCRTDTGLAEWFAEHCARQTAVRTKFQGITPPAGLQQQIVSEYRASVNAAKLRRRLVAVAACLVIGIAGLFIIQSNRSPVREDLSFNGYRNRMARTALRAYGMDVETNDLAAVQAHLRAGQAPTDYSTSVALTQAPVVGGGVLSWQSKPVAMVCYQTGKPLPVGMKSDLILFVIEKQNVRRGEEVPEAQDIRKVSEWFTASWRAGDKIYLLAALDEAELRKRLQ